MKGIIMSYLVLRKLAFLAGFAIVSIVLVCFWVGSQNEIVDTSRTNPTPAQIMQGRTPVTETPDYVLAKHKNTCWTSDQSPKADLPGAAIVQFTDTYRTVYVENTTPRGFKLVDAAFNEALAAVGYGDVTSDKIDVIALCV